ncbi:MAG: transaldolase family protein [Planctomycetota bacterium]
MGIAAATKRAEKSKMRLTGELGADFWNDSCALGELGEAVENGAVGATSNPVIVYAVVNGDRQRWIPVLDRIIRENPDCDEDEAAWRLVETIGIEAAALLKPVYDRTSGAKGFLSMQVNPKFYRCARRMVEHAKRLAALAENIAIKLPATEAGLAAMEEVTAAGINVNATVSFSVAQAAAAAEACARGLRRAEDGGADISRLHPYTTIMVGRIDDHLKGTLKKEGISIDPGYLEWAGVAVFKRAYALFRERGYKSTLLAAAYRHVMHWSELIGDGVVLTIPYKWWRQFEASDVVPKKTLENPVDPAVIAALRESFPDFRRAYEPDGMEPRDFASYGASIDTLNQFLAGYHQLLELVRERMLVGTS